VKDRRQGERRGTIDRKGLSSTEFLRLLISEELHRPAVSPFVSDDGSAEEDEAEDGEVDHRRHDDRQIKVA